MKSETPFESKVLYLLSIISWVIGNAMMFGKDLLVNVVGAQWSRHIFSLSGLFLISGFVLALIVYSWNSNDKPAGILIKIYIAEIILVIIVVAVKIIYNIYIIASCLFNCSEIGNIG